VKEVMVANSKELAALRLLLNREVLAVEVYRRQIWRFRGRKDIAEKLQRAMENEQEHAINLKARLSALNGAASRLGILYYFFGALVLGFSPTLLGKRITLKNDIWVEKLAVKHYSNFLTQTAFTDETKALLEKNKQDEERHIKTWSDSLSMLRNKG
jgi:demethoxyubiquinone hydroxylase (CLK1/Coq7/Cat5 family)